VPVKLKNRLSTLAAERHCSQAKLLEQLLRDDAAKPAPPPDVARRPATDTPAEFIVAEVVTDAELFPGTEGGSQ
jgi:hypothetical protein